MQTPLRVAALLLLSATPAFAAEGEGGLLTPSGGLMFWTILIFLIVLGVLYWLAYPQILGAVEAREERIRELLESAERDRKEAEAYLAEQKRELEEARTRAQEIVAEGRTAGERLKEDLLSQARTQQEEIVARAQRDIHQQVESAMQAVRAEAVDLAIAAASKLVERNLDRDDNRRLVRDYISKLESRGGAAVPAGV